MPENKWSEFESPNYHLQDLGRPAVFLIPVKKFELEIDGVPLKEHLHGFLSEHFTAYTASLIPSLGVWKGPGDVPVFDESWEYKVSFEGKDRIPFLMGELARIAALIGEECIYFEAGQYACLIHPR